MRLFEVWIVGEPTEERKTVEAADARDAVEGYAYERRFRETMRMSVREVGNKDHWTMWTVEPVTTYRARPA